MAKNKKAKHARDASRAAHTNRGSFKHSPRAQAHAHGRSTSAATGPASSQRKSRSLLPATHPQSQKQQSRQNKTHVQPSQSAAHIPFAPTQRSAILLVGEGDFSFAQSLAVHHCARWARLVATSYETREACVAKYRHSEAGIAAVRDAAGAAGPAAADAAVLFGIDATKLSTYKELRNGRTLPKKRAKDADRAPKGNATGGNTAPLGPHSRTRPDNGQAGGWDWIVFNFPHVGGLSTDQRRQVRANQEMLVGFFESAAQVLRRPGAARTFPLCASHIPFASSKPQEHAAQEDEQDPERYNTDEEDDANTDTDADAPTEQADDEEIRAGGRILLTLFDGLPYTLWNVRDLARHAGLAVERSFKFQASAYPGYEHARTLGDLRAKKMQKGKEDASEASGEETGDGQEFSDSDTEDSAERDARLAAGLGRDEVKEELASIENSTTRPGAWRGEDRPARSYIFTLQPAVPDKAKAKRKRGHEESDDDSD